ncbi:Branched-chain-amino-acid aminotransferase [Besnoitia besnoiti]|uniref:Branched-chain-amino-acid aminotransferase n=1 Tax=Besnoitia besnoiti TaxID=94643 RepID=A0A2A9MGT5_BESBE|nr:Branched-chain-amino-acid aminotransferase [Besnoitia besnoiti]PFH35471.1 Branched-chain-amino-acid aminotransferase [Besnoitia besnoiti]
MRLQSRVFRWSSASFSPVRSPPQAAFLRRRAHSLSRAPCRFNVAFPGGEKSAPLASRAALGELCVSTGKRRPCQRSAGNAQTVFSCQAAAGSPVASGERPRGWLLNGGGRRLGTLPETPCALRDLSVPLFRDQRRMFASPAAVAAGAKAAEGAAAEGAPTPPVALADLDAGKLLVNKKIGFLHPLPAREHLGFGQFFTDHMIEVDWDDQHGWYPPVMKPLGPVSLHPGVSSLHYAISAFEGLKAYKTQDERVLLFRPHDHGERLNRSCERVTLPQFDVDSFVTLCKVLAKMDSRFIFSERGVSLYIRPVVFSTYPALGVYPPRMAKMVIMACPTGGYFSNTSAPANLFVEKDHARSWPGGSGSHKVAANYAPTIQPCKQRMQQGFQQLLWTVPEGDDYLWCEGGAMSLFLFWTNEQGENELATPALERSLILPGVVRDTVLTLAKDYPGIVVRERKILMKADFVKAYREGRVHEVFCTGTGAVVKPIGLIHFEGEDFDCAPKDAETSLARKVYDDISDIHYGVVPHHFMVEC